MKNLLKKYPQLIPCENDINLVVEKICGAYQNNNKLLVCGNGGSAADAEHIVGELMKGFMCKRELPENEKQKLIDVGGEDGEKLADLLQIPLPAISLVTSVSLATAFANDVAPELIFAQQVYGLGNENDILLGISTSGNAENVAYAMIAAKAKGLITIGLTGKDGGKLKDLCDISIIVPENSTPDIQELHLPIYHYICKTVEINLLG
ncbi:SIS domain-containing protein [bacterium]|nr:SIS domain-containing protein [bacterium]